MSKERGVGGGAAVEMDVHAERSRKSNPNIPPIGERLIELPICLIFFIKKR